MSKRVGIYLRVSTESQSTELQLREIESYLDARDLKCRMIYEDKLSGTNAMRPALRNLLDDVKVRKIDIVICWKMDRLFRSLKDLINTLQFFEEMRVDFVSLKDQVDMTTSSGRLLFHLIAAFAEFEASLIRERVNAGLRNARRKGVQLGRPRKINPRDVLLMRNKGYSLSEIASHIGATKSAVSKTLTKLGLKNSVKKPEMTELEFAARKVEKTDD